MIDCGCVITCVCLFVRCVRDGGGKAVCRPLCVHVHIEVCLCVTFSVSIFLGSSESRVMWFSPLTASRSNDPGYCRWRVTPQPSGQWCCKNLSLWVRLQGDCCLGGSAVRTTPLSPKPVTFRWAPPSEDNGLLSMLWMISGLHCAPFSSAALLSCRMPLWVFSFHFFRRGTMCKLYSEVL